MSVEAALVEIKSLNVPKDISYSKLAKKKNNVCRSTLTRRAQGIHASRDDYGSQRRLLNPRDEVEVLEYIRDLTNRHIAPTR
jgi:hypothetical protein